MAISRHRGEVQRIRNFSTDTSLFGGDRAKLNRAFLRNLEKCSITSRDN